MGLESSKTLFTPYYSMILKYTITHQDKQNHIKYITNKASKEEYILKEITSNNHQENIRLKRLIYQKISHRFKYLVELTQASQIVHQKTCQTIWKTYLVFQRPFKSLRNQILDRKRYNKSFNFEEIMNILKVCIQGLSFLKQIGQQHQSITTNNILINSSGYFFLSDPWLSFQPQATVIQKPQYFSPQKSQLFNNQSTKIIDSYKSDLFSLGIVGLQVYYLQQMHHIYNHKKQINFTQINNKVSGIQNAILKKSIKNLTDKNILKRETIAEQIKRYSYKSYVYSNSYIKTHTQRFDTRLKKLQSTQSINFDFPVDSKLFSMKNTTRSLMMTTTEDINDCIERQKLSKVKVPESLKDIN